MKTEKIKVWDISIRLFHWLLVTTFVLAYITEDDFQTIHVYSGYTMMALISYRLIWGLIGSKYARFSHFVVKPKTVKAYLKDVLLFRAKRYIGHNPAGAAMIVALLLSLSMTILFGLLTYGAQEYSGPLAIVGNLVSNSLADIFKEIHEFFANFTLLLIIAHVAGVLVASLQHQENLIKSMINGYKNKQ